MAPTYRVERDRGSKKFPQHFVVLRERWPVAFPTNREDVRTLAMVAARQVAATMGWSLPYTLGVLTRWKMAAVYCQAVLAHDQGIGLDGSPAELVDAEAKALATKQMTQLQARKAAKKAVETSGAAVARRKPGPTETPEQLRDRVRAALLRRRAWAAGQYRLGNIAARHPADTDQ
jgi:sRNA-binding protein